MMAKTEGCFKEEIRREELSIAIVRENEKLKDKIKRLEETKTAVTKQAMEQQVKIEQLREAIEQLEAERCIYHPKCEGGCGYYKKALESK